MIQLFRTLRPDLLHKKDRGRPTEAGEELEQLDYGKTIAKEFVPGAEVLLEEKNTHVEINSDLESASDDEEWIDIQHSDNEGNDSGDEESDESGSEEEHEGEDKEVTVKEKKKSKEEKKAERAKNKAELVKMKKEQAQKVSLERILTDEDFKQIEMAKLRKQVTTAKKGVKRKLEESLVGTPSEIVKLSDIENIYKKRKHDKQTRIESIKKGQVDREKFGYKDGRVNEHCSKTNREKRKNKNFQMIKHKVQRKVKRSFKDKQIALRNHLLKLKKMK